MKWIKDLLSRNRRNSLIASETDVGKDLEQDDTQPEKRQRIVEEQSMVVYGQQQGCSSNSQLTSQLVTLYNNSAEYQKIVILTEKLNHLFARRHDVLTELENAEIQPGKKRREVVQHWLTEVDGKEHKIQTMIQDGQGSTYNSNNSHHIESFIKEIDELMQRGEFPTGLVLLDQESTRFPLLLDTKPVGTSFQQNAELILGWLQNHEHHIIGVYGMGGVGKTTLLTHIHDQLLQDSNLSHKIGHVYWVTVSQNCPVRKLQDDIAKVLGLASFQEDDERKRAAVLHHRLAARGRTVLILDDMWEHVSGSKVGFPLENSNCKIILSTRSYDVCRKMGCKDFVIKAETLKEGEAWDLFVEKLGHYDTLEEEAKNIAWEIAKECGGLPLAIATMARSMTDVVDINEWKTAANELRSARGQADMKEEVIPILRYSYDRLNDKTVQECFLSCLLYGEDEKIQITTLIDLWINEGLLDEIESWDTKVAKGHVILNKLESSCLLESLLDVNGIQRVKMHDLIRDMGIIITKEHPVFIAEARQGLKQVPEEEKWSKDLVKVSLIWNRIEEIPSGMAPMTPNLTLLMLNDNPLKKIPDSFFVHMRALTVLDLSYTNIERVSESVSDLENLRVLLLAECGELRYVPSVAKLTKLRTLDVSRCRELKEAPSGLERLKCVETVSGIPWDVTNVIGFNELIQSLSSLIHYSFRIHDFMCYQSDDSAWLPFYYFGNAVWIRGGEFGEDKSSWLVPNTLELLAIEHCDMKGRCLGDVLQSVGEATGVKEIRLKDCRGLKSISGTQQGTPVAKPGTPLSFSHLRRLWIRGCPKLKVVVPMTCTNQLHLPNLETIEVDECEEVEEIFETNKASLKSSPILSLSHSLPNLKKLELKDLPKIKVIFPFTEKFHLPNLEYFNIMRCEEVEEIFGSNKAILSSPILSLSLPNLKDLELIDLPKLKVITPFTKELHIPNLINIFIEDLPELDSTSLPNVETCRVILINRAASNSQQSAVWLPHFDDISDDDVQLRDTAGTQHGAPELWGTNQHEVLDLEELPDWRNKSEELPDLRNINEAACLPLFDEACSVTDIDINQASVASPY